MKYLSVVIAIIINFSCKQAVEKKDLKQTKLETTSKLDTLNADNYNVLFFNPTKTEFNELLKENEEVSGLYEVDSDFSFYTNKVYDSLTKTDVKVKFVTERIIQYTTSNGIKYFDRLKDVEHPYGILFNKINCDPKIKFGIMHDLEILQELVEYNKNCK
jgi:hypothetical protein